MKILIKKRWSPEEKTLLKEHWTRSQASVLLELLPERTHESLQIQAHRMGLYGRAIRPLPAPLDRLPIIIMTDIQRAQLAMMLDCEGTIGVRHGKRLAPYIQVTNTSEVITEKFKELTCCERKTSESARKGKEHWKNKYSVETGSMPHIYCLLRQIVPYLLIKKKQALLLMDFIEIQDKRTREFFDRHTLSSYSDKQIKIVAEISACNKRGKN